MSGSELLLALLTLVAADDAPDDGSADGSDEGTYDEHPQLLQSLATLEQSGTDGTGGVDASASEVDAYEVDEDEAETDGQASEVASTLLLVGRTEHYEHEDASENCLDKQTIASAECACVSTRLGGNDCIRTCGADYGIKQGSSQDGTNYLEHHVATGVLGTDALGAEATQSDGGVDVATTDAANGVYHSYYRETEGNGCAYN